MRRVALVVALVGALAGPVHGEPEIVDGGDLPAYQAGDSAAAAVREANLAASERFWPYQVGLAAPWLPPGREQPLPAGSSGVLVRVEDDGTARIDFGRDGLHVVPVAATDLVERANRVRLGELDKMAPNYVLAIGPRLIDAAADPPRPLSFRDATYERVFLSVFADPRAADFAALAKALAPLRARSGLLTILFPQGDRPDPEVYERLRALDWPVAYVFDHLAEAYTRTQLPEALTLPALLLQTGEGRVLWQGAATPAAVAPLTAAIEQALPATTAATP